MSLWINQNLGQERFWPHRHHTFLKSEFSPQMHVLFFYGFELKTELSDLKKLVTVGSWTEWIIMDSNRTQRIILSITQRVDHLQIYIYIYSHVFLIWKKLYNIRWYSIFFFLGSLKLMKLWKYQFLT